MEFSKSLITLVENELKRYSGSLNRSPKELYEPVDYFLSLGGKRVRPVLVLWANHLFNGSADKALPLAVGIELFHNFSLIHDDIMDNAPLRRGHQTVHEKYNSNTAILSGDVTLVKAYECFLKANLPDEIKQVILSRFTQIAAQVCEGQQMDMNFETRNTVSIREYLKMIEYKTAVLLGLSLEIGALSAGASTDEASKIFNAGVEIGIAFQLQDDMLDVYADDDFGKQKGGDIISNKKTWMLIKALELSKTNHHKYEELVQWQQTTLHSQQKIESVIAIYDFLNIRGLVQHELNQYFEKGIKQIEQFNVGKDKVEELVLFIKQLMKRKI